MIRWIAGAAVGIACVGFGIHAYYRYEEREAAVQEMEARGQQENEDAEDQKNGILTWNGKKYRRNTAMRAILLMMQSVVCRLPWMMRWSQTSIQKISRWEKQST